MKTCPYCGKENPDDATLCAIDGQSLDPDLPSTEPPVSRPPRAKRVVDLSARPLAVKFGLSLLALEQVVGFVMGITSYELHFHGYSKFWYNSFWYETIFSFSFEALLLFFAYRGKNWARWVILSVLIFGAVSILWGPKVALHWDFYFFSLIEVVALAALFEPSANKWYKGSKIISGEPVSAS